MGRALGNLCSRCLAAESLKWAICIGTINEVQRKPGIFKVKMILIYNRMEMSLCDCYEFKCKFTSKISTDSKIWPNRKVSSLQQTCKKLFDVQLLQYGGILRI